MATDWEAEGLLEGLSGEDRTARIGLLDLLESEGVPVEDIKRSNHEGELLFSLAGRAIGVEPTMTWQEVVERSALEEETVQRLLRAQGLPQPERGEVIFSEVDLSMLRTSSELMAAGVPEEDMVSVGRLLGRGFSQAAEAMRGTALRMVLEPGVDESQLALRYAQAAGALTPMIEPLLGNLLKLHLSRLVQTELINAEELRLGKLPGARKVAVAFADLVGFTRLGEEVPPDELGAVAGRLEDLVLDLVDGPVRFVKTIGDAAMVVSPEVGPMVDTALALLSAAEAEGESFPQLRVGVACGQGIARAGDWFGSPVNLASRVTGVAYAGSVLATEAVHDEAPDAYRWSKAGIRRLKGVPDAVPLWRARRLEADAPEES